MKLQVEIRNLNAVVPTYAYKNDAGMDLYSNEDLIIHSREIGKIRTGIAIKVPIGHVGLILDKSGIAANYGFKVMGGVIDPGYAGEVIVALSNLNGKVYHIASGNKIAQLLIIPVEHPEIEIVDKIETSDRGEKGFGSSGLTKSK